MHILNGNLHYPKVLCRENGKKHSIESVCTNVCSRRSHDFLGEISGFHIRLIKDLLIQSQERARNRARRHRKKLCAYSRGARAQNSATYPPERRATGAKSTDRVQPPPSAWLPPNSTAWLPPAAATAAPDLTWPGSVCLSVCSLPLVSRRSLKVHLGRSFSQFEGDAKTKPQQSRAEQPRQHVFSLLGLTSVWINVKSEIRSRQSSG